MLRMRATLVAALAALLAFVLAGCGSSGGKSTGGPGDGGSSGDSALVADVSHPDVKTVGSNIVASAQVKVGGVAGKHLTLEWGLVDALQGNESQQERVIRRYVTTRKVVTHTESISIPLSRATSPLLVHFVIYAPDGSYLDSADTKDFGKGT
jgi:hypothetical protein